MEDIQLSAWGLADDLLQKADLLPTAGKYLLGVVGSERVAIADRAIREVVDRPNVTPWLRGSDLVGVFALRGDIYTLTDPLAQGEVRRVAVVLEAEDRYLAVGLDEMSGVQVVDDSAWREFESKELVWARRIWDNNQRAHVEIDPALYIDRFKTRDKESAT